MGYPKDLDEFDAEALIIELRRRVVKNGMGRCDYCTREYVSSPCRFPRRHCGPPKGLTDDTLALLDELMTSLHR